MDSKQIRLEIAKIVFEAFSEWNDKEINLAEKIERWVYAKD